MTLSATPERRGAGASGVTSQDALIALGLFAAGLLVRLHQIGELSLWVDEATSLAFARGSWHAIWVTTPAIETNPPLYYAFLKLWIGVFGISETSLRLPSALASALAVVPIYALARAASGRPAGLLAGALYVLSGVQVAYGQEARTFAAMTLAFFLALWFARVLATEDGRPRALALAALILSCTALPFMHHTGYLAVAAVFVFALTLALLRGSLDLAFLRTFAGAGLGVLVLTAPVLYWILGHLSADSTLVDWIPQPGLHAGYGIYRGTFGFNFLAHSPSLVQDGILERLADPYRLADGLLGLACLWGIVEAVRRRNPEILAILAALAFVVAAFFLASQIKPILLPRTVLFASPLLLLIAAHGALHLPLRAARPVAALLLLLIAVANVQAYFRGDVKEPWREALAAASALHDPGTRIVTNMGELNATALFDLYWPAARSDAGPVHVLSPGAEPLAALLAPDRHGIVRIDAPCPGLAGADRVVLIERHASNRRQAARIDDALAAAGASLLEERPFPPHLVTSLWSGPACPG